MVTYKFFRYKEHYDFIKKVPTFNFVTKHLESTKHTLGTCK